MNQQSRNLRRAANQAFLESLQVLGADTPASSSPAPGPPASPDPYPAEGCSHSISPEEFPPPSGRASGIGFSSAELEQAIADIEQYLQQQVG
ncbi:hypothetical protein [Trichothermofontia sp.]